MIEKPKIQIHFEQNIEQHMHLHLNYQMQIPGMLNQKMEITSFPKNKNEKKKKLQSKPIIKIFYTILNYLLLLFQLIFAIVLL